MIERTRRFRTIFENVIFAHETNLYFYNEPRCSQSEQRARKFIENVYRSNFCFDGDVQGATRGGGGETRARTDAREDERTETTYDGKADRKARCNYCWELDQWKMYSIIVPSFSEKAGRPLESCLWFSHMYSRR